MGRPVHDDSVTLGGGCCMLHGGSNYDGASANSRWMKVQMCFSGPVSAPCWAFSCFLRTCFQGEIKKLRGSLFPFKEAIKK